MNQEQINKANQLAAYRTIPQFIEEYQAFTNGGIRNQIYESNSNGLKACGAIIKNGRRVLINPPKYLEWLELKNHRPTMGDNQ